MAIAQYRTILRAWSLCGLLAACLLALPASAAISAGEYYEDALRRYEKQDIKGAIIQLKNALQQNPKMLPAQVLLADAYLLEGQPAGAEAALEAAAKLGADRTVIYPKLGQALLQQYEFQAMLERLNPRGMPPPVAAEVMAYRGRAYMELGDLKQALRELGEAEQISPESVTVQVAKGTALLRRGDMAGARTVANRAVALAPKDADTWTLKGSVAHAAGDLEAALADYGKAISLKSDHMEARIGRVGVLLDRKRDAEAGEDLALLQQRYPMEPRVAYLSSLAAARRNDSEGARKSLSEVAGILDLLPPEVVNRSPQLLLLGGLAHHGLKQPEKANVYLRNHIALQPGHAGARKLLASLLLDEGDYNGVIELLQPVVRANSRDPQALTLLASAYLGKRHHQRATQLFEQAARLAGNTPDIATGLGMSRIGAGDVDAGMALLQEVFAKDPGQTRAGLALVGLHLRRGEPDKAIQTALKVIEREPDNLTALNQLGIAYLAAKQPAKARAAFHQAATLQRNYMPAQLNIARLDYAEGKRDIARKRLQSILKVKIDDPAALHELARIEVQEGRLGEAINWLEKLRESRNQALGPMLYLVDLYLRNGNVNSALSLAQELGTSHSDNLAVLETLGRAYLAASRPDQARVTFRNMSRIAGYDTGPLTRIARLLMEAGDIEAARFALNKALQNKPDDLPARIASVELDIQAGRLSAAEKSALELRAAYPQSTRIRHLLGAVYMAQKNWARAAVEYKAALEREPNTQNALILYRAHVGSGDMGAAIAHLEDWLRAHPKDDASRQAIAEGYLLSGNLQAARATYEDLLKRRNNDVGILNNLANVLLRLKDPRALGYAQQAHALAPNDPNVADTLGWILVRQGQAQQALPYLRDARLRAPGNPVVQYHLGVALHQLGRKPEARRELQGALATNFSFEGMDEARALLQD